MSDSTARISAAQVTQILQRAAELDADGDALSLDELRHIATEAGIDPAATDAAIRELMAEPESASPALPTVATANAPAAPAPTTPSPAPPIPAQPTAPPPSPLRVILGGAVGMAVGFFAALPEAVGLTAFGGGILYIVTRAIQSMKRGAVLDFQLQNFTLWFGMFIGMTAIEAFPGAETFAFAFLLWIVTSVVGGLLVRFGPRHETRDDDPPQIGPGRR